jgi:diacylglycerol kinase (ATP)
MKTIVVINPTAGQHRAENQASQLNAVLDSLDAEVIYTESAGDAERIALGAAISELYGSIVAVGGDGTINEIVNGILQAPEGTDRPTIGIIPMGTSNILATELGIPAQSPLESLSIIQQGRHRLIDIGSANGRYFTMMASFGFDAEAVKRVQPTVKYLMGAPAYILSGITVLAQHRASKLEMMIDDVRVCSEAFVVVVANTSSYAIEQVKIAPFAAIDDGWLDICIFERPPNDKIGFLGQILLLMARRHLGDPRVRYYRGRRVAISAEPPMLGQIDGDLGGETPTVIEIHPRSVSFFVP